jgi:hypothetical protein
MVLRMYGTVETSGKRKKNNSGCDIASGYLSGVGDTLYPEKTCETVETKCAAKGDPYCEFEMRWFETLHASAKEGIGAPNGGESANVKEESA